jgi:hypothetical protein
MGEFVKKEYLLNKNIAHLIDYIFWNMPFKTPTAADRVIMCIMFIAFIMPSMHSYIYCVDCVNYVAYVHHDYADYVYCGNYEYYVD